MPVFTNQQLKDMEPGLKKAAEASLEKMIYTLLEFEDHEAMLRTADLLLTEESELTYVCGELHQLGYESMMESGDRTPNHKITVLFDWADNKLESLEEENRQILLGKPYNSSVVYKACGE